MSHKYFNYFRKNLNLGLSVQLGGLHISLHGQIEELLRNNL